LQRNLKGFVTLSKYLIRGSRHDKGDAAGNGSHQEASTPAVGPPVGVS
jgi:hypothetical protein